MGRYFCSWSGRISMAGTSSIFIIAMSKRGQKHLTFGSQTKNSHRINAMAISFFLWWTQQKYVLYCIQSVSIPDISRIVFLLHHNINVCGSLLKLSYPAFWECFFIIFFFSVGVFISTQHAFYFTSNFCSIDFI